MNNSYKKLMAAFMTATLFLSGCGTAIENTTEVSQVSDAGESTESTTVVNTSTESTAAISGESFESTGDNEHAITADGESLSYDGITVNKTGAGEGDESDFYGTNAAVFATNGGSLTISNATITTAGSHANAVFSYGEGSVINISDSTINTTENNSGGIMVTGGGTLNASNLKVNTKGGSSAAIRSDRGGGTLTVDGGTYESYGAGSPAIYSTADITVSNATLYSDIAQAIVVEGANSVTLNNVDATGQNTHKNSDKSDRYQAVMIYQSMSGDASEGKGVFTMNGGSLTSLNEGMFFVTNTVAEINLTGVTLNYASDDLLRIEAAGWGNSGSNGGQVTFTASEQELSGVITVDETSNLNLYLKDGSTFTGQIAAEGDVYVELSEGSKWVLTGDSTIKALTCDADAIDLNGYTLTVDGLTYKEGTASTGSAIEIVVSESNHSAPGGDMPSGEKPSGDAPSGEAPSGERPEMPSGEAPSGNPPEKPDGEAPSGNPPEKP